jgi:hypothetical protein
MKNIIWAVMLLSGTAHAVDPRDYGYGYRYHGYNSLEQQQEAQRNQYNLQQIEQTQLDMQILNRVNGGQEPMFRELYGNMLDTAGEE